MGYIIVFSAGSVGIRIGVWTLQTFLSAQNNLVAFSRKWTEYAKPHLFTDGQKCNILMTWLSHQVRCKAKTSLMQSTNANKILIETVISIEWGRTGTVVSVGDYGPRGPWFESWPGRRSLWQITFTPCLVLVKPRKPWTYD